ncbi:DNA polymerase [Globicatella sp. HMSC072A10]|uniref:Y-family DNA polymerase n=1 Tax=Globicatella sp. HMSC072A10 TaxID=1739315 RepID=UPI0008B4B8BE|nr:Y-family DNA polymerase [Globicatella sp. HMSC072A10]OFK62681.1 DNA polymerase [Globicatella sp. HMSC072A10]
MGYIDYSREPRSDIAFIDMKSFYASVECVELGLNPLTTSLCVMSRSDNSNGLILASSPLFKKVFGKKNVSRSYDLPFNIQTRRFEPYIAKKQGLKSDLRTKQYIEYWAQRTYIVPPRMGLYIERNLEIQAILQNYSPKEEILPYSIDEGFIDLTRSLDYFIPDRITTNRKIKLDQISKKIQTDIFQATGIYSTIGMSNANPLLAKLALDNEAKHNRNMRANWSYEDVETKVWQIPKLTDFWGIGSRTEKRLNKLKIYSIKELANANPDDLNKEFGIIGLQLWFHANGVDESNVLERYHPRAKGIGNSQILPKNYYLQSDIELVLSEMAEQVAIRLRRVHKKATNVAIHIGFSNDVDVASINTQMKVDPTQSTKRLTQYVLTLFRKKYKGHPVRSIAVRYSGLVDEVYTFYTLFDDPIKLDKQEKMDHAIDEIRSKYGFLAVQKANSLLENSRMVARSKLIGGHSAGGLDGLS